MNEYVFKKEEAGCDFQSQAAKSIVTPALFSRDFLGWGKPAIMLGGPSSCSVEKPCGEELLAAYNWPAV